MKWVAVHLFGALLSFIHCQWSRERILLSGYNLLSIYWTQTMYHIFKIARLHVSEVVVVVQLEHDEFYISHTSFKECPWRSSPYLYLYMSHDEFNILPKLCRLWRSQQPIQTRCSSSPSHQPQLMLIPASMQLSCFPKVWPLSHLLGHRHFGPDDMADCHMVLICWFIFFHWLSLTCSSYLDQSC